MEMGAAKTARPILRAHQSQGLAGYQVRSGYERPVEVDVPGGDGCLFVA